jgi:cupin fold WbuC family metalloprotein
MNERQLASICVREESPDVLYADQQLVHLRRGDIDLLVEGANSLPRQRIRLCAHRDIEEKVHEMFIVHRKGIHIRPHKHPGKSESFHVIEGIADVVLFGDDGNILNVINMGSYSSGACFYYRLTDPIYHTLLIRSEVFVFQEVAGGPFNRSDMLFAPWAPDDQDESAVKQFSDRLEHEVRSFSLSAQPSAVIHIEARQ